MIKEKKPYNLIIIGGGASGMMAAISLINNLVPKELNSKRILLLERNDQLGKKLLITGKERCNLTTNSSVNDIVKSFGENGKFLWSALTQFPPKETIKYFEKNGVPIKLERGGRFFPKSENSYDILRVLEKEIRKSSIEIGLSSKVENIRNVKDIFEIETDSGLILSERILIATGGKSYPGTGSTGDGYKFAEDLGHTIIPPLPSLIGLKVQENEVRSMAGLALKNVSIKFYKYKGDSESKLKKENLIEERFGEMLFTHVGISGPIVLDSSRSVVKALEKKENIIASVDWKPAVETHVLQKRVNRIFHENPNVKIKNLFRKLLPQSAIEHFLRKISIDPETPSERILKKDKIMIVENLKNFDFRVIGYESIEKAIITSGGVKISEINPSTMKSKLVDRLFFTGEVIDVDGPTGGYNLQAAWSTGWLAGLSIFRND